MPLDNICDDWDTEINPNGFPSEMVKMPNGDSLAEFSTKLPLKENNLSDIADKQAARENLNVYSKQESDELCPMATDSIAGKVKLNNTLSSASDSEALAASQGKILKDKLDTTSKVLKVPINSITGKVIDFFGIPFWAKKVTIMLSEVSTSGVSDLVLTLGSYTGFEDTGYSGSVTSTSGASIATFTHASGIRLECGSIGSAAGKRSGSITLNKLEGDEYASRWVSSAIIGRSDGNISSFSAFSKFFGALTSVRLTTINGTDDFDGGFVNLMYE